MHPPQLDDLQKRILNDLTEKGIAVTSLEELFPGRDALAELRGYIDTHRPQTWGKKTFIDVFWEPTPPLDLSNPFVKLATEPRVVHIVNAYMEMWSKLVYYHLGSIKPVPAGSSEVQSQRWHRDPEEKRMCKLFVYLTDVKDKGSGPFTYVPESVRGQKFGHLFPQRPPAGSYPPDEKVAQAIPEENIKRMTGKAGTVMFCDTTGIHKGGYVTDNERIMFTAGFNAPTYARPRQYTMDEATKRSVAQLPTEVRFVLTGRE